MTVTATKPAINLREALKRSVSMYGLQIATALQGGALNDVNIGGRTPAAGAFTSIAVSGEVNLATLTVDTDTLVVDEVNGRIGFGTGSPDSLTHYYHATLNTLMHIESGDTKSSFALSDTVGSVSLRNSSGSMVLLTGGDPSSPADNAVAATTIDANGALLHGTTTAGSAGAGDIVVNGGIFLGGSAAANELNDYEEGTWTPSVGGDATYTFQVGTYTKIGNLVTINGLLQVNVLGTGSTTTISGMPFTTSNASGGKISGAIGYIANLAVTTTSLVPNAADSVTSMTFHNAAGQNWPAALAIFGSSTRVDFSMTYTAA